MVNRELSRRHVAQEEIAKVPKDRGPGGTKGAKTAITAQGKSSRKDAMPSGMSRACYQ